MAAPADVLVENKKARLKFALVSSYSAGIELEGFEVKSLRAKQGSLDGARVIVRGGEAYLVGMTIPPFQAGNTPKNYDPARTRRLLMKRAEIAEIADIEETKGLTIVPFEVYNNRYVKVRVAVVKGKGKADKREDMKKRDAKREAERVLKNR